MQVLSCLQHARNDNENETDIRITTLEDMKWEAYKKLIQMEYSACSAMHRATDQKDPTLFPWVFLMLLQLTNSQTKYRQDLSTSRDVQLLAERCLWMNTPWSTWSDLLPSSIFDASAQHYAVIQLTKCITAAIQVIA